MELFKRVVYKCNKRLIEIHCIQDKKKAVNFLSVNLRKERRKEKIKAGRIERFVSRKKEELTCIKN